MANGRKRLRRIELKIMKMIASLCGKSRDAVAPQDTASLRASHSHLPAIDVEELRPPRNSRRPSMDRHDAFHAALLLDTPQLSQLARHRSANVRWTAVGTLGLSRTKASAAALLAATQDSDRLVRLQANYQLNQWAERMADTMHSAERIRQLISDTQDDSRLVRDGAVASLASILGTEVPHYETFNPMQDIPLDGNSSHTV